MGSRYHTASIVDRRTGNEVEVFYRAAGDVRNPVVVLLHGFPSSSHQFRGLIERLADRYRLIAPDIPGFGFSGRPDPLDFEYSFEHLAEILNDFLDHIGVARFALYAFDYGADLGFRLAVSAPERITAIISQNGNAYEEGLGAGWTLVKKYWREPSLENRAHLTRLLWPEITELQYRHGERDPTLIAPEAYTLDQHFLGQPHAEEIQVSLLADYHNNIDHYAAVHLYFREYQPPVLVIWSEGSPVYEPAGAEGFHRDLQTVEVQRLEAGHFALETHLPEIAFAVRSFLGRTIEGLQDGEFAYAVGRASARNILVDQKNVFKVAFGADRDRNQRSNEVAISNRVARTIRESDRMKLKPLVQDVALAAASRSLGLLYDVDAYCQSAARHGAGVKLVKELAEGTKITDETLEAVRKFASVVAEGGVAVHETILMGLAAKVLGAETATAVALAVTGFMFKNIASGLLGEDAISSIDSRTGSAFE